ncbi:MAG: hypothetical protein DMG08_30675 [Acidobacteria bacterium]|nr:MAG: hypothetical protein DMG08_30675 [Acidobacteriota bacterium]
MRLWLAVQDHVHRLARLPARAGDRHSFARGVVGLVSRDGGAGGTEEDGGRLRYAVASHAAGSKGHARLRDLGQRMAFAVEQALEARAGLVPYCQAPGRITLKESGSRLRAQGS